MREVMVWTQFNHKDNNKFGGSLKRSCGVSNRSRVSVG